MNANLILFLVILTLEFNGIIKDKNSKIPVPQKKQVEWQEAELGIIFHYDISIFEDRWIRNNMIKDGCNPKVWNPKKLDTDQWIQIAKEAGCKYAVLTATHFQGFMNWQSDIYPFGLKQSPWKDGKGDLLAEFVASCRKYGLKPGIYMSTHRNFYHKVDKHKVNWGEGGEGQTEFNRICERMVEELLTKNGDLFEFWFDAGCLTPEEGGPNVVPIFEKYQPNCIFYKSDDRRDHRWCGYSDQGKIDDPNWSRIKGPDFSNLTKNEVLDMLHHGTENGTYWSPAFSGLPLCNEWLYRPGEAFKKSQKSVGRLVEAYRNTVGRNANLVLGATPDRDGLIPDWQESILVNFGKRIKAMYDSPVKSTSGKGNELVISFNKPTKINYAIIKEKIAMGERIRFWKLEGFTQEGWVEIKSAQSIGHKRIVDFEAEEFSKIRFFVSKCVATPIIDLFSVGLKQ